MAEKTLIRRILAIFDRASARKTEAELAASLGSAGKKGGENFLRELRAAFDKRMADLKVQLAKGLIDPKQFKAQATLAAKEFNTGIIAGMEKARAAGTLTDREYLKLSRTLKKVGDEGAESGGRIGSAFFKLGTALAGLFALQRVKTFFVDSIKGAIAAEESYSRLDVVLRALGLSYRQVSPEVERYLNRLQKSTRFSDEDGREALVNLVTITGDYRKALSLLDLTANIAEKRHTTMAEAANTAGAAALGLSKGMKDLGIKTGETGDIVGKLQLNLGNLAEEAGTTTAGKIAIVNNLWDEFKEKIGAAILGSDNLQNSVGPHGLQGALESLNSWAENNSKAISGFIDKLVAAGRAVASVSAFIVKHTPNLYTLGKAWDFVTGKTEAAGTATAKTEAVIANASAKRRALTKDEQAILLKITEEGGTDLAGLTAKELAAIHALHEADGKGLVTLAKDQADAITAVLKGEQAKQKQDREHRARALAAELERIEIEIAVRTLQVEQGLTEALAREMVRRQQLLHPKATPTTATEGDVTAGLAQLDKASLLVAAGLSERTTPAVKEVTQAITDLKLVAIPVAQEMTREEFIRQAALRAGIDINTEVGQSYAALAGQQFDNATNFASPWVQAMQLIRNEIEGSGTLFHDLAMAWAEGGIVGIARFALLKVKENLAFAIEEGAKAIGSLFTNPAAVAAHATAAVKHGIAAAAWGALANVAGGGGSGGSGGSGGAVSVGTPNLARAQETKAAAPEITIVLTGPGFNALNPKVQEIVYGAMQQARERYGQDAKIRIKGAP